MYSAPNYETARKKAGFNWSVASGCSAVLDITKTPIREFNLDYMVGIEAYKKGRPLLREMFGEEVPLPAPATPPISYGADMAFLRISMTILR